MKENAELTLRVRLPRSVHAQFKAMANQSGLQGATLARMLIMKFLRDQSVPMIDAEPKPVVVSLAHDEVAVQKTDLSVFDNET